jgi:hypothetical protein
MLNQNSKRTEYEEANRLVRSDKDSFFMYRDKWVIVQASDRKVAGMYRGLTEQGNLLFEPHVSPSRAISLDPCSLEIRNSQLHLQNSPSQTYSMYETRLEDLKQDISQYNLDVQRSNAKKDMQQRDR